MDRRIILALGAVLISGLSLAPMAVSLQDTAKSSPAAEPRATAQAAPAEPQKGSIAPDFTLMDLDGKKVQLSSFKGKATVLNFWATWCEPCKIEMPWLVDLQKKYGPQGLQVVGVAMDDAEDKEIANFAHKMGVNYVVLKGTEKVGDLYGGLDRLPSTYYIDRSGKIIDETIGLVSESTIEDAIKRALNESQPVGQEK